MIVVSVLLIMVAVVLLVVGLWQPSSVLLSGSIAASLLAATALVVAARRTIAGRAQTEELTPVRAAGRAPSRQAAPHPAAVPDSAPMAAAIPIQAGPGRVLGTDRERNPPDGGDEDLPDEPAPQQVSAADAARVGRMTTDVLVVDGRPRYHLPGCVHLLGREHEPLPVSEAIELGFSPCSLCEPDSALLADARRV